MPSGTDRHEVMLTALRAKNTSGGFETDTFAFAEAPSKVTSFGARGDQHGFDDGELTGPWRQALGAQEVVFSTSTTILGVRRSRMVPSSATMISKSIESRALAQF
ncbi:hypothetical protein ACFPOD_13505 [Nitratireductor kimnyeongensis]|uniref:Uncharacterized protein n=1 Tax=Nitratireductor kimnyeongensis TaxID=430679 RepID=A0ABW0T9X5_9HYPH|nr:hypothetical protein [Nitratireductor kimnyeongensis]QZZ35484.1 hypothetical protein KW403_17340 [Nitratireductor kimnyeongensis]